MPPTGSLAADPGNLRAPATAVYLEETQAQQKTNPTEAQPILDKEAAQAQTDLIVTKSGNIRMPTFKN